MVEHGNFWLPQSVNATFKTNLVTFRPKGFRLRMRLDKKGWSQSVRLVCNRHKLTVH
jgi:hypothetical protein